MKACYCPKIKAILGDDKKCEWCAVAETRSKCAQKIRGAVPVPLHARTDEQKNAMTFIAETFYRVATDIEKGD